MEVLPAAPWPVPRVACDHRAPAGWRLRSTHRTSAGTVAYARCACGAWLALLDGQPLATAPMKYARAPGSYGRWQLRGSDQTTNVHVRQQGGTND
jgi:hypothetical protein